MGIQGKKKGHKKDSKHSLTALVGGNNGWHVIITRFKVGKRMLKLQHWNIESKLIVAGVQVDFRSRHTHTRIYVREPDIIKQNHDLSLLYNDEHFRRLQNPDRIKKIPVCTHNQTKNTQCGLTGSITLPQWHWHRQWCFLLLHASVTSAHCKWIHYAHKCLPECKSMCKVV